MNQSVRTLASIHSARLAFRLAAASQAALQQLSRASRSALHNLPGAWRRRTTLRHVWETDAAWMNDQMPRDVGVVEVRRSKVERDTWSRLFDADARSLLAAALVATAVQAWACDPAAPGQGGTDPAHATMVGVFNGEFVNGAPVYRLPPIAVVARRKAPAEQAAEDGFVRARQARAKAAVKPPA